MIAAEKSALSMVCSIATGLGYSVMAVAGIVMFSNKNSMLHFLRPICHFKTLFHAAANGSSEMATALVTGIVTMMFNWTMLKYVGENGVAAITIIMYVLMFATSLYTGYSYRVAPMISYYYGEQNHEKLKKLVGMSLKIISVIAGSISIAITINTKEREKASTAEINPLDNAVNIPLANTLKPIKMRADEQI